MRRIPTLLATLSLAAAALVAGATEPAAKPTEAQATTSTSPDGAKITKSRSNIQNNREATPTEPKSDTATPEAQGVVKTKTKSNQSND